MKMVIVNHADHDFKFLNFADAEKWIELLIRNKFPFSVTYL